MANHSGKGKGVDYRGLDEEGHENNHVLKVPVMFPGLNKEREMSAMVEALTHVVRGEVPEGGDYKVLHQNIDNTSVAVGGGGGGVLGVTGSAIPSSSSSSYGGNSALKRSRENDTPFGDFSHVGSSPAIPASKHQI